MKQHKNRARKRKQKSSGSIGKRRSPPYSTLTIGEKAEYKRSIDLLYDVRHGEGPYTKLLRKHRLTRRKAEEFLGSNLIRGGRGKRVRATKADRLVREVNFPTRMGDTPTLIRGSSAATKLSNYYKDREDFLATR